MDLHPSVEERLARLAPDQREAATAPPGPLLCVAPAGSGKTTTLVARVAWLIASGAATPGEIAAITFNTRAAEELRERLASALEPLGVEAAAVRVRTFHALGLEILRDSGLRLLALSSGQVVVVKGRPAAGEEWGRVAATVSGRVTAKATGAPVVGASVSLALADTTLRRLTSDSGTFTFPNVPSGQHTITVRYIGYRPLSKKILVDNPNRLYWSELL